jgi:hypothetical protein
MSNGCCVYNSAIETIARKNLQQLANLLSASHAVSFFLLKRACSLKPMKTNFVKQTYVAIVDPKFADTVDNDTTRRGRTKNDDKI